MATVHDPIFTLPPRPPFRWGTSPFHARGALYRDEIGFANSWLNGGLTEVLHRAGDPGLEAFFAQRFSTLEWYDMLPTLYCGSIVARARGVTFSQHVRETAIKHAQRALTGLSGVVLKLLSNEAVATWLPRASGWYHDFGGAETHSVGPCHVRGARWGVPQVFVQAWGISAMHFTEHVLAASGAKEPRAHTLEAEPDGMRDGQPLYKVGFEVSWRE